MKDDELRICVHCQEPIQTVSAGDEIWDWCESCQLVEGGTITVDAEQWEREEI
jgi:hypothetical protein